MRLFYYPRTCALAAHIEHLRRPASLMKESWSACPTGTIEPLPTSPSIPRAQYRRWRLTGPSLTETHAILTFLGDLPVETPLLPRPGDFSRYRAHEWINFCSGTLHVYIRSLFRPSAYGGDDAAVNAGLQKQAVRNLASAVGHIESNLTGSQWALGDAFSVVDSYLFLMYLWSADKRMPTIPDRPRSEALARMVWERPAVKRVVAIERRDRDYRVPEHWH
jgi:glutathione S-transferase